MIAKLKKLLARAADSEPVRHALLTFAAAFVLSLVGFLNDVQSWMATGGHFPSVAILAKAAASALTAAATGLASLAYTKVKTRLEQPAGQ